MAKRQELTEEQRQALLETFRQKYPRTIIGGEGLVCWFLYPLGDIGAYEGHVDKVWNRETKKYVPGKVYPPRITVEECPTSLDDWRIIPDQTMPQLDAVDVEIAVIREQLQKLEDKKNALLESAFAHGERVTLETAREIEKEKTALRDSILSAERTGR